MTTSTADVIADRDVLSSWIRSAVVKVSSTATFVSPLLQVDIRRIGQREQGFWVTMKPSAVGSLIPSCR